LGVIVATGAVAAEELARHARSGSDYVLPVAIAILTALLAVVAFRFASKNRGDIGEARFDTTRNGG
jgi:hypothetical protein